MFVTLLKKHSDYGKPIRKEISFTRREIGRLIGRKEWGGRDSEQLVRALHEIHHTFITTHLKKSGGRYQRSTRSTSSRRFSSSAASSRATPSRPAPLRSPIARGGGLADV